MVAEEAPGWRLSAKTGACHSAGEETSNWYVGYVEKGGAVYYFALQMGGKDYGRAYSERIPISRAILTELGILNGGSACQKMVTPWLPWPKNRQ
jgi:beta-lactamase class D